MLKELCDCGKIAQWCYMPGYSGGGNSYSCDDCISSPEDIGCSCNWHHCKVEDFHPPLDEPDFPKGIEGKDWRWVEFPGDEHCIKITKEDGIWTSLDEKGRPYPCCEYDYSKEGYDKDESID